MQPKHMYITALLFLTMASPGCCDSTSILHRYNESIPTKRVAVVVMNGFETLDALGPHSVFQSAQISDYKHINLGNHRCLIHIFSKLCG